MGDSFDAEAMMRLLCSEWTDPEPGSEMHGDNEALPDAYASLIPAQKLFASLEHLEYFFAAKDDRAISAPYTVLRSALVGAAQAYWCLCPEEGRIRLERALRLAVEDIQAIRTYENCFAQLDERFAAALPGPMAVLDSVLGEIQATASSLGIPGDVQRWRLNTTDMIADVSAALVGRDHPSASALMVLWRSKSAHAHAAAFAPALTIGLGDMTELPGRGLRVRPRHNPDSYVASAAMVMYIIQSAFKIFERRRAVSQLMQ